MLTKSNDKSKLKKTKTQKPSTTEEPDLTYSYFDGGRYFSNLPYLGKQNEITLYSGEVKITRSKCNFLSPDPPERKQHDITGFSENSRRRLLRLAGKINFNYYGEVLFVTNTFHNMWPESQEELKKLLNKYLKQLQQLCPSLDYIWRLELQKRGAPHYHFLFFTPKVFSSVDREALIAASKNIWLGFLEDRSYSTDKYASTCLPLDSRKHVFSYVSKYVAKEIQQIEKKTTGRRYGYSRKLNLKPVLSYICDEDFVERFRYKVWQHLKKTRKFTEEFKIRFFSSQSITSFVSFDDAVDLVDECAADCRRDQIKFTCTLTVP